MKGWNGFLALVMGLGWLLPASLVGQDPPRPAQEAAAAYVVGQAEPPVPEGSTLVEMSLEGAIARALEANLDIQTARLTPLMQDYSVLAARAAFSPTLSGTYGYTSSTNQSTSQLDGGARTQSERQLMNTSLSQTFPWYGGRMSANFNNSRLETNNSFSTRNPSYSSQLSLSYTQPLLSGLKIDNQRAALETQQIQRQITDLQLLSQIENITAQVREAYWNLRATIEQIEIQRRNLAQANRLLEDNRLRVRLGRMTEMQVVQAEAQVASGEQALLNAEIQWRNQEFAFKRLLLSGADDPLLAATVNPVDDIAVVAEELDIPAAIEVAVRERADLRQQRQQRDISEVNLEVNRSNTLPDLNLTAQYSLQGVGGNLFDRTGLGGEPVLVEQGGYSDGLRSIVYFDTPTWSLTLNASYPLGTNAEKANLERARLQLRQTDLALKRQELAVVTEVTSAGLAVRNTFLQLQAAIRNREAAERNVEAELTRFNVGAATNFEVVAAQDALTAARLSQLRALIDHVNAIAEFDRVQRVGR